MPQNDTPGGGIFNPAGGYDSWGDPTVSPMGPGYPGGLWIEIPPPPGFVFPDAPPPVTPPPNPQVGVIGTPPPNTPEPAPLPNAEGELPPPGGVVSGIPGEQDYSMGPGVMQPGGPQPSGYYELRGPGGEYRLEPMYPRGEGPKWFPFPDIHFNEDAWPSAAQLTQDMGQPRTRPWPDRNPFPPIPGPGRRAPRTLPRVPRRRRRETQPPEPFRWPTPFPPYRWPEEVFPERPLERIPQPTQPEPFTVPRAPGVDLPPPNPPPNPPSLPPEIPTPRSAPWPPDPVGLPSPNRPGGEIAPPPATRGQPIPAPSSRGAPAPSSRAWPPFLPWPFSTPRGERIPWTSLLSPPTPAPSLPPRLPTVPGGGDQNTPPLPLTPPSAALLPFGQPRLDLDEDPCHCRTRKKRRKCRQRASVIWAGGPRKGKLAGSRCYSFEKDKP